MTSLITVTDGDRVLMCDSRCYNAIGDHCECICNYLNHGVGIVQAIENSPELAKKLIRVYDTVQAPLLFGNGVNNV